MFAMPLSLIALIPSVFVEYREGQIFLVVFDILALLVVGFITLSRRLTLYFRKITVAITIALVAVVLTASLGSFSMGCIYLFSLSVFAALQFEDRLAYGSIAVNLLICLGFGIVINYNLLDIPITHSVTFSHWVIYSSNFLFMDLVVVTLIRQILNGLQRTMRKEALLFSNLQKELAERKRLNVSLKDSEEHYKTLFFQSPSPKLIFDMDTLQFLQVNKAAVRNYNYTEQEFLSMKLSDIHPDEKIEEMLHHLSAPVNYNDVLPAYTTQHLAKHGKRIHAEITRSDIRFEGRQARMIVATDISQLVSHTDAIRKQNDKLKEIAHMQSHVIRLPLTRIMSLSGLINDELSEQADPQLLRYLNISVNDLDEAVKKIVHHSEEIMAEINAEDMR
ncbi:hypothetical protein GCM10023149_09260 [Mucilaginibacter gynuensis]|uniref:PAS domain S-box-containing protein n=2 Tax=Mucilaginibacter gynuensis TaxID=1302236 RepID=A0ABP8FYS6_9SPHI